MPIDLGRWSWLSPSRQRAKPWQADLANESASGGDDRECESYYYCSQAMRNTTSAFIVLAQFTRSIAPLALVLGASIPSVASAQTAPELPQPSPKARVEQRVGITDVALDYSSPGVKGRKIWG